MSLTKCPHCEDQHACHQVDGVNPGQLLYEKLYALYNLGKIGTTVFPWDQLSPMEQDEWEKIAVT